MLTQKHIRLRFKKNLNSGMLQMLQMVKCHQHLNCLIVVGLPVVVVLIQASFLISRQQACINAMHHGFEWRWK